MTLSQIGLALRFNRSTSWIRSQGRRVTGAMSNPVNYGGRRWTETWTRMQYSDGRLAGYKFASSTGPSAST